MHLESRFHSPGIQNFMVLSRKMQIFRNLICKRRHYKLHKTIFKSVRFDLDFEIWAETWCTGNQNFDVFSLRVSMTFDPQNELTRQKLHTDLHYIISATREWPGIPIWSTETLPTLKKNRHLHHPCPEIGDLQLAQRWSRITFEQSTIKVELYGHFKVLAGKCKVPAI